MWKICILESKKQNVCKILFKSELHILNANRCKSAPAAVFQKQPWWLRKNFLPSAEDRGRSRPITGSSSGPGSLPGWKGLFGFRIAWTSVRVSLQNQCNTLTLHNWQPVKQPKSVPGWSEPGSKPSASGLQLNLVFYAGPCSSLDLALIHSLASLVRISFQPFILAFP